MVMKGGGEPGGAAVSHRPSRFQAFPSGQEDVQFILSFDLSIFKLGCSNSEIFVAFRF